jgi:Flp pilus assembly protein TadG
MSSLVRFIAGVRGKTAHGLKLVQEDTGSALVEMALSSIVLFGLFFGLFQLTMTGYTFHMVSDIAREATRWAIVRGSTCSHNTPGLDHCGAAQADIQNYIQTLGLPGDSKLTATVYYYSPSSTTPTTWTSCDPTSSTCNQPGYLLKVVITDNYSMAVPFLPTRTIPITSTSQMVYAQ